MHFLYDYIVPYSVQYAFSIGNCAPEPKEKTTREHLKDLADDLSADAKANFEQMRAEKKFRDEAVAKTREVLAPKLPAEMIEQVVQYVDAPHNKPPRI